MILHSQISPEHPQIIQDHIRSSPKTMHLGHIFVSGPRQSIFFTVRVKFESLYEYLDSNPRTLGMSSSYQSSTDFSKIFLCSGSDFENSVVSLMSAQCTRDWKENANAFIRRAPRHWRANKNVFPQLATNFDCQDYLLNFPETLNVIIFNNLGSSNNHSKVKNKELLHLFINWA